MKTSIKTPPPVGAAQQISITANDPLAFTFHPKQAEYELSEKRFVWIPAARRTGKTWIAKRRGVKKALQNTTWPDCRIAFCAPTYSQVKRIYWDDLKRMLTAVEGGVIQDKSESELMIRLVNGSEIWLIGMDKPDRFEGSSWNWVFADEVANMKPKAIEQHIMPALSERLGGLDQYGVPEGMNHYYRSCMYAQEEENKHECDFFWWTAREVMPIYLGEEIAEQEIARAQKRMDDLTFRQEYEAEFIHFVGKAYHAFDRTVQASDRLLYDPQAPLHLCFDFNVEPGVCIVIQEGREQRGDRRKDVTLIIDEVTIRKNSTTPLVSRAIGEKYKGHKGQVYLYGDATGGARGSAKVRGSDWDLIKEELMPYFGNRMTFRVPRRNPPERVRVNAVNSRFRSSSGVVRMLIDPSKAPDTATDFDEVVVVDGGSGEIDKKANSDRTHHSDAVGYYVFRRHPVGGGYKIENKQI